MFYTMGLLYKSMVHNHVLHHGPSTQISGSHPCSTLWAYYTNQWFTSMFYTMGLLHKSMVHIHVLHHGPTIQINGSHPCSTPWAYYTNQWFTSMFYTKDLHTIMYYIHTCCSNPPSALFKAI